ncbi:MAG: AAA family ATPase, partial [Pyrinomonadaceae bacterium]
NEEATLALAEAYAMRGGKLQAMEILDRYLSEVGNGPTDLRVPATVMRRRIADRMHPRVESIAGQSALVGRGAEMEQLAWLLDKARQKNGQACLVWGDAGVGKSRLLAEFVTFASLQGIPTQRVQCRPSDPHRPLSVFVDLVPGLRTMRGAIGCAPETFEYLDRLTKHKPGLTAKPGDGDSEFIYAKVQQALFDLIDAVTDEGCLIVLIEDVHWIDSTSAQLLREMVAWGVDHSIFFAFTGRDGAETSLSGLATSLRVVHLLPLESGQSKDVILGVVRQRGREIEEEYLDWCVSVAEGNPYFLQELANQWLEQGSHHAIPISLAAVLNERISRLSDDALLLLQTCALLEKNSTLDRLEKVAAFETRRMLQSINELGLAGMLVIEPDESGRIGADQLRPRHDLLSNAALMRLSPPARAFLHRRAGTVLETEIVDDQSAAALWDCTAHWQLSGNVGRAFSLAKSCAKHLMDVGLASAAADAFEKSLSYCSTSEEKLSILRELARAHHQGNNWNRVVEVVGKARTLQQKINSREHQHDDTELMGMRASWLCAGESVPIGSAIGCLNDPNAPPDHRVRAGVLALMMLDQACHQEAMPEIYRLIVDLGEDSRVALTPKLEARMVYHTLWGELEIAVEAARQLIAHARALGNTGDLCRLLCNASLVFRTAGLFDDASAFLNESDQLAVSLKLHSAKARTLPMIAHLAFDRGDLATVRTTYGQLLAVDPQLHTRPLRLDIAAVGARLALFDHKPALARKRFPESLSEISRDQIGQRQTYRLALYVAIELGRGKLSRAAVNALETIHLASRRNLQQSFAATVLYRALRQLRQSAKGERLLKEYVTDYRREKWPIPPHFFDS